MAWTLTRHLLAPYRIEDNGMDWDAYHQWLIVSCEQIVDTDPLFLMINPDDFTDISWFHSNAVGHTWTVYEFVFSLYDNSIYMLATKSGFGGSKYLVRYNLGGVWQFETVLYYTQLRENPANNDLWVADLTGGFYTNNIFKISRVDGSVLTTYNVGRAPSEPIFDSAGNYYFTSFSSPLWDKTLFKVDLSTGTVTSLLTYASTLTDLVYNPTTNRLWICTNSALWIEYDIAGNALTGASITMPTTTRFGLNYLDPNTTDAIWGTRYFDPQRICAQSLSDATVAEFTVADGITSPGSGTFASPRQDWSSGDPVLVYGERLCFYSLDLNEDTSYYDIQEACPPDCPTLTIHDVVGYPVSNGGIGYDATNDRLIVNCYQFISGSFDNTRPIFASINPDDFTDVTSFNTASPSKQYGPYEFFVSNYDASIYISGAQFGVIGFTRHRTARYSLAGVWQWETALSDRYCFQFRENPQNLAELWAAEQDGGAATPYINHISRTDGSQITRWDTGHDVRNTRFDASGHIYFTEYVGPGLFKLNVATGAVSLVYTHSADLFDLVYNAATNRMWLSGGTTVWTEFDCATDTVTGTVRTTSQSFHEGTGVLNPNNNDTLFGENWSSSTLIGISLADGSVEADYDSADGLNDIWPGTFTDSSRPCFFALNDNPVLMPDGHPRYDVVEVCICADDVVVAGMPDGEVYWPNPRGRVAQRGMLSWLEGLQQNALGLYTPAVVPPVTLRRKHRVRGPVIGERNVVYEFTYRDFEDSDDKIGIYDPNNH